MGAERDVISHIAEILGAVCQDFFVRKANAKKGLVGNTHLVVNAPEGSKFEAALKWEIPAVDKGWVIACAKQSSGAFLEEGALICFHASSWWARIEGGNAIIRKKKRPVKVWAGPLFHHIHNTINLICFHALLVISPDESRLIADLVHTLRVPGLWSPLNNFYAYGNCFILLSSCNNESQRAVCKI